MIERVRNWSRWLERQKPKADDVHRRVVLDAALKAFTEIGKKHQWKRFDVGLHRGIVHLSFVTLKGLFYAEIPEAMIQDTPEAEQALEKALMERYRHVASSLAKRKPEKRKRQPLWQQESFWR